MTIGNSISGSHPGPQFTRPTEPVPQNPVPENPWQTTCPDWTVLKTLGHPMDELTQGYLELHVESCPACQGRLQQLADETSAQLRSEKPLRRDIESNLQFPGFRVVSELGRGGESIVYLAEDLRTSRLVALKLIARTASDDDSHRRRWLTEVRVAARMQHHNIVRLYQVEETPEWFLLVFEYISGGTLRDWLNQPATALQIARLMSQIAAAISQIHQQGILHLDLKPSNILIDDAGGDAWSQLIPKVSDFGLAIPLATGAESDGMLNVQGRGTPSYMAPEQVTNHAGSVSPATDVYGLGGILYTLLTGQLPFNGETPQVTLSHVLQSPITIPDSIDDPSTRELLQIAVKCLEKAPAARFQDPLQLAAALDEFCVRVDAAQKRRTSGYLTRRMVTLFPWMALIVVIFAVIVFRDLIVPPESIATRDPSVPSESAGDAQASTMSQPVELPLLSMSEWLSELELEAAAFDVQRANRLADSGHHYVNQMLESDTETTEGLARYGVLQQRLAERFSLSAYSTLYAASDRILADSVRLLHHAYLKDPQNEIVLVELVSARFLHSQVRHERETLDLAECFEEARYRLKILEPTGSEIKLITDSKQQMIWVGKILDHFRMTSWNAAWRGQPELSRYIEQKETEFWNNLTDDLKATPDAQTRHLLMRSQVRSAGWPALPATGWLITEHQKLIEREAVYYRLADDFWTLFNESRSQACRPVDQSRMLRMFSNTLTYMAERGLPVDSLPLILHEDLGRPLSGMGTIFRMNERLADAECLQKLQLELCEAAKIQFPNNEDIHLAACEAQLQAWKNLLRRDRREDAIAALRISLEEARQALTIAPQSERARFQLGDRMKRLTRVLNEQENTTPDR